MPPAKEIGTSDIIFFGMKVGEAVLYDDGSMEGIIDQPIDILEGLRDEQGTAGHFNIFDVEEGAPNG